MKEGQYQYQLSLETLELSYSSGWSRLLKHKVVCEFCCNLVVIPYP